MEVFRTCRNRLHWNGWITSIVMFVVIDAVYTNPIGEETTDQCPEYKNICFTPGCIHAASNVLKNMDSTIDPCDDFYQFACGNYIRKTHIPDDKIMLISFYDLNDRVHEQLKTVLEEPIKADEPRSFVLTKQFYKACINMTAVEEEGLDTAKSILLEVGGWPVLEGPQWKENKFNWMEMVYKLRKAGLPSNYFIPTGIEIDIKNASRRIVTIDQAALGIVRETLLEGFENAVVNAYYKYLVDIAVIFGADKDRALRDIKECIEFEISLAKLTTPEEERRNVTVMYNPMTVEELQQKYPNIPWIEYLNNIIAVDGITFSLNDTVNVAEPKFITELVALLDKTPKRVQANYVSLRTVKVLIHYLTKQLRTRQLKFKETAYGVRAMQARWKECVEETVGGMDIAVSALYVRRYFHENTKKNAKALVSDLQNTFLDMLKQIDWMDANTRKRAIEKADEMVSHIGYPEELFDDKEIEENYANMESAADSYLQFDLNVRKFLRDTALKKLRIPVNKQDWKDYSSVARVNAGYSSDDNSIQLPAGILQGVFFDHERPNYMNYGAMGFVIGHEITHGFDDMGRQFDKDGELSEWWEAETKEAFIAKAKCIIDQYSNYTAPEVGLNLNGLNTQGENIADNGGIKEAYLAYNAWVERNGEEPRLPGLDYTPKQMFWISTANVWCSKVRDEYLKLQILTDTHSPPYYRILGSFSNSEYFSADFNCPIGSKMNPKHKCHVW